MVAKASPDNPITVPFKYIKYLFVFLLSEHIFKQAKPVENKYMEPNNPPANTIEFNKTKLFSPINVLVGLLILIQINFFNLNIQIKKILFNFIFLLSFQKLF